MQSTVISLNSYRSIGPQRAPKDGSIFAINCLVNHSSDIFQSTAWKCAPPGEAVSTWPLSTCMSSLKREGDRDWAMGWGAKLEEARSFAAAVERGNWRLGSVWRLSRLRREELEEDVAALWSGGQ